MINNKIYKESENKNMQINKNDKFVATKKTFFLNEGEIVNVTDVNKYGIMFTYGNDYTVFMDCDTFENHFEKVVEKKPEKAKAPTVTEEHIQNIIDNSEFEVFTVFDKCTVVVCKLPNGFVITESSACVSPENYDMEIGASICFDKIVDKVWELEGYKLQNEMYNKSDFSKLDEAYNKSDFSKLEGAFNKIKNNLEMFNNKSIKYDVEDNCWNTDLDCYDCNDFGCKLNPNTHLNIT